MSNAGKGMRPMVGYNYDKYAENYDRIFKPARPITPWMPGKQVPVTGHASFVPTEPTRKTRKCKKNPTK